MENRMVQIYETVMGLYEAENGTEGMDNLFASGELCDRLYAQVYEAKLRINQKLEQQEDRDVELIIRNLTEITKIVSCKMYTYGVADGKKASR